MTLAPQSGLRSHIVYDHIPADCIVHEITDDACEPLLHNGEMVIVDLADFKLMHGELFLIQWQSGGRAIMETRFEQVGRLNPPYWRLCPYNRPRTLQAVVTDAEQGRFTLSEGPYEYLDDFIVGRVIGIYEMRWDNAMAKAA